MPSRIGAVAPIQPPRPIERVGSLITDHARPLPPATRLEVRPPFIQALREALHALRDRVVGVRAEDEPVTRYLGFRSLDQEAQDTTRELDGLDDDERTWAESLRAEVSQEQQQAQDALDDDARADLAALLQLEQRHVERTTVRQQLDQVTERSQARARTVARLVQEEAEVGKTPLRLPRAWLLPTVVTALAAVTVGARVVRGLPLLGWSSAIAAAASFLTLLWLVAHPLLRRGPLVRRLAQLRTVREAEQQQEAEAAAALRHALKVFEDVDAACRREEDAAQAVFHRRPGVQRYLKASGPVVTVGPAKPVTVPRG